MNNAIAYCNSRVAASGSNFYYSFLFLPPEQRTAIVAIYAFCHELDDLVTSCLEPAIAQQKLLWWSTEVDRIFNGVPQHPIAKVLAEVVKNFSLPRVCFDEILQGKAMDLKYQGYETFADLKLYCHCVSSTVGILTASVFGYRNPNTLEYAKQLGIALRLVNIIRDLGQDARRGHIYIPEEYMAEFNIKPSEILQLQPQQSDQFQFLLHKFAAVARQHYDNALALLAPEDRMAQRGGLIMAKIYFSILTEIENSGFDILNQKIALTPLRKLWIAWSTWRAEKVCVTA